MRNALLADLGCARWSSVVRRAGFERWTKVSVMSAKSRTTGNQDLCRLFGRVPQHPHDCEKSDALDPPPPSIYHFVH